MNSIEIRNLNKSFGGNAVIRDFSFTAERNGHYYIKGSSGSGKSTLLNLISGLLKPDSGEINGTQGKRFSYVFQDDRLIPYISAGDNIGIVSRDKNTDTAALLTAVGLSEAGDMMPEELSGGMSKRIGIARAIAYDGDIFLLDEPFNGLDSDTKIKIADLLRDICKDKTVFLVTHQEDEARLLFGSSYGVIDLSSDQNAGL